VIIKRVQPEDVFLFDHVSDDVFDEPIDRDRLVRYLSEPNHLMAVAIDEQGRVLAQGAAVIHRHPDKPTELYVDELGVAPSHHRQGIGRKLLEELLAWGRELGCELTWVGTEVDNFPARGLYENFGQPSNFVMYEWNLTPKKNRPSG
jgi:aminoglycoside 6'-N-acetyltransferase I